MDLSRLKLIQVFACIFVLGINLPCFAQEKAKEDSLSAEDKISLLEQKMSNAYDIVTELQASLASNNIKPHRNYEAFIFHCIRVNGRNSSDCKFANHFRLEFRSYSATRSNNNTNFNFSPYQTSISQPLTDKTKNKGGWGISIDQYSSNSVPDPDPSAQKDEESTPSLSKKKTSSSVTELNSNGLFSIIGNYFYDHSLGDVVSIGGFLGVGFSVIHKAEATFNKAGVKRQFGFPSLQYGMNVTVPANFIVSLVLQYKTTLFFPEDIGYIEPINASNLDNFPGFNRRSFFAKTDFNVGLRFRYSNLF